MNISDMIKLANNGITAKDLYTLNKAGFTAEIIEELSKEDGPSLEKIKEDAEAEAAARKEAAETKEKEANEKEALLKENEALKAQLEELQRGNRGKDHSDPVGAAEGSDINKVVEAISSMM